MRHFNPNKYNTLLIGGILLFAAVIILIGLVFTPSFIAENFSRDGILSEATITKILICRWGTLLIGALLLSYGILKLIGSNYAHVVDRLIKEMIVQRFKQPQKIIAIIFTLLALISINRALNLALTDGWKRVTGYEYYLIAKSLAEGHGYSCSANNRWYYSDFKSEYPENEYYPTAIEEPVYPFLLATAFKNFENYGKLFILIFHVLSLYLTSIFIYLIGRKVFDSHLSVLASIGLILWWWPQISHLTIGVFNPAIFAGMNTSASAYFILWLFEKVSIRRGVVLGCVLGFCSLTLAAGLLFIPLAAIFILFVKKPVQAATLKSVVAMLITVAIVLMPWTIRNYIVFRQFIPVRTGFGLALHQSNPIFAATFSSGTYACTETLGPLWQARDAAEAIYLMRTNKKKEVAIYKRSYDCIELKAPENYHTYNEAQRDKVYLAKSINFILLQPRLFVHLSYQRIKAFFAGWNKCHALISLMALVGATIAYRNRKSLLLVLLVIGYSFTFTIIGSWYYRYRYPIDPIIFVLSSGIPIIILAKIRSAMKSEKL